MKRIDALVIEEVLTDVGQYCMWVGAACGSVLHAGQCCMWVSAACGSMLHVGQCCMWVSTACGSVLYAVLMVVSMHCACGNTVLLYSRRSVNKIANQSSCRGLIK